MAGLILIVDDEEDLVNTLEYNLQREHYQTRRALDGRAALQQAALEPVPDLVLLDLMLPDMSGIEVCRRFRMDDRTRRMAVVMLTAKTDEIDRVVGFEVGADDYVTKPFSVRELLLRVRAVLRRVQPDPTDAAEMVFGPVRVDSEGYRVWVEDTEIHLTPLELRLLVTLLSRRGRVQSRERLLEDVWDMRGDVATRTVDTHVRRLREKLGPAGELVETIRGVGYRFCAELAEPAENGA